MNQRGIAMGMEFRAKGMNGAWYASCYGHILMNCRQVSTSSSARTCEYLRDLDGGFTKYVF